MRKYHLPLLVIGMCMLYCQITVAQESKPSIDSFINLPSSYFIRVQNKYAGLDDKLTKQTEKYLQRLFNREKRIQRKLAKIDSTGAQQCGISSATSRCRARSR